MNLEEDAKAQAETQQIKVVVSYALIDRQNETDNLTKIDCTTIVTYRNTKTGETYKENKEGPDIVQDVTVGN